LNGEDGEFGLPSIGRLVEAMDEKFDIPTREVDKKFLMSID